MNYIVTQEDIDIVRQPTKDLYFKLELLNRNFKILDYLEGNLITDSISIDAESDCRRTFSCEFVVTNSSFYISKDKIWLDKYLRPYIGIKNLRTQEIKYYLLGTFCMTDTAYNYNTVSHTLSLTCNDLISTIDGTLNGVVEGYEFKILSETNARTAVIETLNEVGITKYNITDMDFTILKDLEFKAGVTAYEIIKEIVNLKSGMEIFFDLYGTFHIQQIPQCTNDISILNDEILKELIISESLSCTFSDIANHVQVWGLSLETDYYSSIVNNVKGSYQATVESYHEDIETNEYPSYENYDKIALKIPTTNITGQSININSLGVIPIVIDDDTVITENYLTANSTYVFRYRKASNDFLLLGQYRCFGEAYLTSESDFSIEKLGYEVMKVITDENIYTDELCNQRARYEIYYDAILKDSINLEMIAVPWLDVNQKITYTPYSSNVTSDYIIKSISYSMIEHTMSVNIIKHYDDYV